MGRVRIGIAGWSYNDWKGVVYPAGCKDTLQFCARLVDCIEINSSFYRTPTPRVCASWVKRTEGLPFFFTAKLPREFTHEGRIESAGVRTLREAFAPLAEAGKLRALLAQFSYRTTAEAQSRWQLAQIADACRDLAPLVVEVRHRSWAEEESLGFLRDLDVSVANLDYPGSQSGFGMWKTGVDGSTGMAYLRLHGRNHGAWFRKDAGRDEVYDYEYRADEVAGLRERIEAIAADAVETVVIANNHFQGQGMKVALELAAACHDRKVEVPGLLLDAFPAMREIARSGGQGTLFT